jgi:hypothetical protein
MQVIEYLLIVKRLAGELNKQPSKEHIFNTIILRLHDYLVVNDFIVPVYLSSGFGLNYHYSYHITTIVMNILHQ